MAYGIIHDSIFDSSVADDWRARVVIQDLVVLADESDNVMMTLPALIRRTGIPEEVVRAGVEALEAPDPADKSGELDGRRITPIVNGRGVTIGWHVVNRGKYKRMMAVEWRKKYFRDYRARKRAEAKSGPRSAEDAVEAERELEDFRGKERA